MAAVAPSGFDGGLKETNHVSPGIRAVKPGAKPALFSGDRPPLGLWR
jgi:hypothetical protein